MKILVLALSDGVWRVSSVGYDRVQGVAKRIVCVMEPKLPGKHAWSSLQLSRDSEECLYQGLLSLVYGEDSAVWVEVEQGGSVTFQLTTIWQHETLVFSLKLELVADGIKLSHSFTRDGKTITVAGWPTFSKATTE